MLNALCAFRSIIRNKETQRGDFIFYSDRIIRLLVEEALNHLPFVEKKVITPMGAAYDGLAFKGKICGVSIMVRLVRDQGRSIAITHSSLDSELVKVWSKGLEVLISKVGSVLLPHADFHWFEDCCRSVRIGKILIQVTH